MGVDPAVVQLQLCPMSREQVNALVKKHPKTVLTWSPGLGEDARKGFQELQAFCSVGFCLGLHMEKFDRLPLSERKTLLRHLVAEEEGFERPNLALYGGGTHKGATSNIDAGEARTLLADSKVNTLILSGCTIKDPSWIREAAPASLQFHGCEFDLEAVSGPVLPDRLHFLAVDFANESLENLLHAGISIETICVGESAAMWPMYRSRMAWPLLETDFRAMFQKVKGLKHVVIDASQMVAEEFAAFRLAHPDWEIIDRSDPRAEEVLKPNWISQNPF